MKTRILFGLILILIFIAFLSRSTLAQDFPRICLEDPANLMPNCKFDNGLDGWQPFTESGGANISYLQGGGECHAPQCPAAHIIVENNFVGGIFQQVPVAAGNTYYTNINWFVFDSLVNDASINNAVGGGIGRRIGIDPFGGTDSTSPNVVWSTDNWRSDCKTCQVEFVSATAQADVITVFIRIDDTWRQRAAEKGFGVPLSKDQFWLDEVGLKQISGDAAPAMANPTEPPPTNTPEPAQPTATPLPPTDTPAPEIEPTTEITPTQTALAPTEPLSPVSTPVEEAATIAPPPTLTPTMTRTPTPTPTPRPVPPATPTRQPTMAPAAASFMPGGVAGIAGTTICAGGVMVIIMAVAAAGLVWLYRLGWGNASSNAANKEDFEDDDALDGEIIEN